MPRTPLPTHYSSNNSNQEDTIGDAQDPVRPHACPMGGCLRRFKRRFTLKEHIKTHSGAKPFLCPVPSCRKSFTTSGNLSRHKRAHPWLKTTLECLIVGCGCTFTTETKLERHMKMAHFGSSTHLCPRENCGGAFSTAGNLKRHLQLQHAEGGGTTPPTKVPAQKSKYRPPHSDGYSPVTTESSAEAIEGEEEFSWSVQSVSLQPGSSLLEPTDVELLEALSCLFETEPNGLDAIV